MDSIYLRHRKTAGQLYPPKQKVKKQKKEKRSYDCKEQYL
jgi:hypothetical protein